MSCEGAGTIDRASDRLVEPARRSARTTVAVAVSIVAHAAAGVALLAAVRPEPFGDATQLDAISVSLVDALEIARTETTSQPMSAAAAGDIAPPSAEPPPPDKPAATDEPAPTPSTVEPSPPRDLVELILPQPSLNAVALSQPPVVEPPEPPVEKDIAPPTATPDARERVDRPDVAKASASPPAAVGATATLPDSVATVVTPPVSAAASAGDAKRYARGVAVALSRSLPKGIGQSGRVEIEFTIAEDGRSISDARIARSSGVGKLDQLARTAVARATYPPPPKGLTVAQRTFRVPFNFD